MLIRSLPTSPVRVAVTGAGIVTSLGIGWPANAEGFRAGCRAIRGVTLFDVSRQRSKLAAEVDLPDWASVPGVSGRDQRRLSRGSRLLLLAAHEALEQSGWERAGPLPVIIGTTSGGMASGEEYLRRALATVPSRRGQASRVVQFNAQQQGLDVCRILGVPGSVLVISNACASGANAVGEAFQMIRSGLARRVFAGGCDALCQLTFAGFDSLRALSPSMCRPFETGRDGLTLGEGAAMLALESMPDAKRRGAEILGEIAGYGAASDNHHLTQPHPEGKAALAAMRAACGAAGVTAAEIDYVNAHGTATMQNDSSEAVAINLLAEADAPHLSVSSTKACIGHLLGGAGAVEAVVALMTLRGQWLPPQSQIQTPDPVCRFHVVNRPMDARVRTVLSNSFGFGGANAALLIRRFE